MRRTLLTTIAALSLIGCTSAETDTTTTTSSDATSRSSTAKVTYSTRTIGSFPGAVDLVERDSADDFFYVVSRNGTIERWSRDGSRIDTVLDISADTTGEGERGLLGLAFRRNVTTWTAFINYTNADGSTVIAQYDVAPDGTFRQSSTPTGQTLLTIPQPYANHNGGALAVGPDNMLYIGTGDGGSSGDPDRAALNTSSLLGKILRIDPTENGYDIPVDNPFVSDTNVKQEIWSIGLRNPWRINFDSFGNLWVADVGQNKFEEVSVASASENTPGGRGVSFGWSAYEANERFNTDVDSPNHLVPVHQYSHEDGRCSISGSAIGTNSSAPGRAGWYFYGDYCSGEVTAILSDGSRTVATETVATGLSSISAVRATSTSLYVLSLDGDVRVITVTRS
jgi:glucose/arabinose dehydrogenase